MFPPVDAKVKQITEILLASESLQTFWQTKPRRRWSEGHANVFLLCSSDVPISVRVSPNAIDRACWGNVQYHKYSFVMGGDNFAWISERKTPCGNVKLSRYKANSCKDWEPTFPIGRPQPWLVSLRPLGCWDWFVWRANLIITRSMAPQYCASSCAHSLCLLIGLRVFGISLGILNGKMNPWTLLVGWIHLVNRFTSHLTRLIQQADLIWSLNMWRLCTLLLAALFSHSKPRPDANSVQGLPCKNKAFYSPVTQHGRRVIMVYCHHLSSSFGLTIKIPSVWTSKGMLRYTEILLLDLYPSIPRSFKIEELKINENKTQLNSVFRYTCQTLWPFVRRGGGGWGGGVEVTSCNFATVVWYRFIYKHFWL